MGIFLSKRELEQVEPAENAFHSPTDYDDLKWRVQPFAAKREAKEG